MADVAVDYPAVLTKKGWDKNKGVIAKMAVGKTDVGAALSTLEEEFKKSGLGTVKFFAGTDPVEFLAYEKGLVAGLSVGATALKGKIASARTVVDAARREFEASKTVPKSSTAYVKSILDGLTAFDKSVTSFGATAAKSIRSDYAAKLKKLSGYSALSDGAAAGEGAFSNLMAMIKKVEANPTIVNLHNTFASDGPHRKMTTYCKLWDQLVLRDFPKLGASVYSGKAMAEFFNLPGMADVANETAGSATKKLTALVATGKDERKVVTAFLLQYSSSAIKSKAIVNHMKAAWAVLKQF